MDYALCVEKLEAVENAYGHLCSLFYRKPAFDLDAISKRPALGVFADDHYLPVMNVGVDYWQDIWVTARLLPERSLLANGVEIYLVFMREFDGDPDGHKGGALFGEPNGAKAA